MAEKEQVANTEATKETTEQVEVNEPKEATFTQSQVNNIIKSRLESEKAKQQKALDEQKILNIGYAFEKNCGFKNKIKKWWL